MSPEYQRYLASREWALLKQQVRQRSGGKCENCHVGPYEQTHHLTYQRIYHERLEDLQALCRPCHEFASAVSTVDPAKDAQVRATAAPMHAGVPASTAKPKPQPNVKREAHPRRTRRQVNVDRFQEIVLLQTAETLRKCYLRVRPVVRAVLGDRDDWFVYPVDRQLAAQVGIVVCPECRGAAVHVVDARLSQPLLATTDGTRESTRAAVSLGCTDCWCEWTLAFREIAVGDGCVVAAGLTVQARPRHVVFA